MPFVGLSKTLFMYLFTAALAYLCGSGVVPALPTSDPSGWLGSARSEGKEGAPGTNMTPPDLWNRPAAFPPASSAVAVVPGELPGYTGWARPERTLAGHFRVVGSPPPTVVRAGAEWSVTVRCSGDPGCGGDGRRSHFFLRAYGPAVLAGEASDLGGGMYRLGFYPVDPGQYTVEAVLAFSSAPPFGDFPLPKGEVEPGYEGYLLRGFPLLMNVVAATSVPGHAPVDRSWCRADELIETSGASAAIRAGRWRVVDKVSGGAHRMGFTEDPDGVSLGGYQRGPNSLGILMEYTPIGCDLLMEASLLSAAVSGVRGRHILDECLSDARTLGSDRGVFHFVLIGDSVMRLQEEALRSFLGGSGAWERGDVRVSRISTFGGISRTLGNITSALRDIREGGGGGREEVCVLQLGPA